MSAYLSTFEPMAEICEWPQAQWTIRLRGSLSGPGLLAVASLPVDQQADYATVRRVLLSTYQISTESYRRKVFDQNFDQNNPDRWLRTYHQNFDLWLDSPEPPERETLLIELVLAKLPSWLEGQMRNLNCHSYAELTEAIIRHLGNSKAKNEKYHKKRTIPTSEGRPKI